MGEHGPIRTYRDLLVWQKGMAFVTNVYSLTRDFPQQEMFGLTMQVRRSATSIPMNIAEGFARRSTRDYLRFLRIASGSLYESQTQIEIARNLDFLSNDSYRRLLIASEEIERMLAGLIRKLDKRSKERK